MENNSLKSFEKIKLLFTEFAKNMKYVSDRRASVDFVQFPNETLELKGGDCDDLSVCFSSLLESIGIQTAFIDYKPVNGIGHVTLLINTNLSPNESGLITINERKYFVRKNYSAKEEVWIPIEITSLNSFDEAWNLGATKFYSEGIDNFGLSNGKVEIVDVY
ncbi:MAG: transglutaminase-like domain-containing protein [Melioribacteraceae bacterium]|nr:transglutaminase-like domain-containing protein [Melioribacteraceae bacterium]